MLIDSIDLIELFPFSSIFVIFVKKKTMTLRLKRFKITVEEYYKMAEVGILKPTDRVELIEGEIITMSPVNDPHIGIVNILNRLFAKKLIDDYTISIQNPIRIDALSEPEPDIVIAKFDKKGYSKSKITPAEIFILVEVSDSTLVKDRKVKLPLYAQAEIPEYWIIDVKKQQIEQYTNPKSGKYTTKKIIKKTGKLTCKSVDFKLKVADLFI